MGTGKFEFLMHKSLKFNDFCGNHWFFIVNHSWLWVLKDDCQLNSLEFSRLITVGFDFSIKVKIFESHLMDNPQKWIEDTREFLIIANLHFKLNIQRLLRSKRQKFQLTSSVGSTFVYPCCFAKIQEFKNINIKKTKQIPITCLACNTKVLYQSINYRNPNLNRPPLRTRVDMRGG